MSIENMKKQMQKAMKSVNALKKQETMKPEDAKKLLEAVQDGWDLISGGDSTIFRGMSTVYMPPEFKKELNDTLERLQKVMNDLENNTIERLKEWAG